MSVSPLRTTLTNILLPSPAFSADNLGGLAALSQLSPGSFSTTQPTLAQAFLFGTQSPPLSQARAPLGSDTLETSAIPVNQPIQSPAPEAQRPAPPEPRREENQGNDRFKDHPRGGPPGQMKKDDDHRGPGNGNGFRPGNPSAREGSFNRKSSF